MKNTGKVLKKQKQAESKKDIWAPMDRNIGKFTDDFMSQGNRKGSADDYPELTQKDIDRAVRRKGLKIALTLDTKGRLTLPQKMREDYNLKPGDYLLVSADKAGIRLAKTENPFDILAENALNKNEQGNSVEIRELARTNGIKVSK
jgi:AbrB family looped-hinge helix DNA binding protein